MDAHAGSRARVTNMGGLYDAATLRALMISGGFSTNTANQPNALRGHAGALEAVARKDCPGN